MTDIQLGILITEYASQLFHIKERLGAAIPDAFPEARKQPWGAGYMAYPCLDELIEFIEGLNSASARLLK